MPHKLVHKKEKKNATVILVTERFDNKDLAVIKSCSAAYTAADNDE